MNIAVNGKQHELAGAGTLDQLLMELNIVPERVAVMVNDRVVPKASRAELALKDADRVEILTFIGGG